MPRFFFQTTLITFIHSAFVKTRKNESAEQALSFFFYIFSFFLFIIYKYNYLQVYKLVDYRARTCVRMHISVKKRFFSHNQIISNFSVKKVKIVKSTLQNKTFYNKNAFFFKIIW